MFFLLSKILNIFISPFVWILILWGLSYLKWFRSGKRLLQWSAVICFIVFSNGALFQWVLRGWEGEMVPVSQMEDKAKIVVVLGGMTSLDEGSGRIQFHDATDRLMQALLLYYNGCVSKLVISGGSAEIMREEIPESEYLKPFLMNIGIEEQNLFIERRSRNTYENALYTKELFEQQQFEKRIILVTSAFHMHRAKACFERQGFQVESYAAQFVQSTDPIDVRTVLIPSLHTLNTWPLLLKEWMGIVVYQIKGYL
ncbi:MAG: YdcF family protein [Marinilabiliaceae bacterium]|nr:YdcF family protein [Marinilabiliaceae bacterium]